MRIKFRDRRTASAVNSALLPDNVDVPEGMQINQKVRGNLLEIKIGISGQRSGIETLISTLDEFVAHIYS
ncbi:MAG: KEOPS complex subunit Pcc1, partial [Nitrososphaerales archaeon]